MYYTIQRAIDFIRKNYQFQPSLDEIASHVNLSKFHFQRLFQEWAGVSPKTFLQYVTVENAKKMLQQGKPTLQTSLDLGLSGNGRLHDLFVKMESVTPGQFKNRGEGLTIHYQIIPSLFGEVLIAETELGVCEAAFIDNSSSKRIEEFKLKYEQATLLEEPGRQSDLIRDFFSNYKTPADKIMLDMRGTAFQVKIWKALLTIPEGSLLSYADIAGYIGNPKASRAVGTAIGSNCLAILIPCHRVIRQSGELGGYRWGETRKAAIIALEATRNNKES
jgi:AraC family transcriptional regulator of adaptative response/methylated-DNA-[protein]-cysteine methyltransferase